MQDKFDIREINLLIRNENKKRKKEKEEA